MDSGKVFKLAVAVLVLVFVASLADRLGYLNLNSLTGLSIFEPRPPVNDFNVVIDNNVSVPQKRTIACENNAPVNSTVFDTRISQTLRNGAWEPQDISCEWRCNAGYEQNGNACVDVDECVSSDACTQGQLCKNIVGGYVCRGEAPDTIETMIFDSYPVSSGGKSVIYGFLNDGNISIANELLNDNFFVPRFGSVHLQTPLTWEEDPFKENYWRFLFYSLRETRHLGIAGEQTQNPRYYGKLAQITESFIDTGIDKPFSWDLHGTAFRTMVLVNTWWKLREAGLLTEPLSTKILEALQQHGEFLENEANYQGEHNHGITQAAALLLLAENFPDLPQSPGWRELAKSRLNQSISENVDADGVLTENSPYYHFYSLGLYWEIHKYSLQHNVEISPLFEKKIRDMIRYGVYVLEPNRSVPTLGASLEAQYDFKNDFVEMAELDPNFKYVFTEGTQGTMPPKKSIVFPVAGQSILRSGWGQGTEFQEQTQVIFDFGPYRTKHSDFDALSFHLFAKGDALMPDSGLFTYETGKEFNYFHGTSAHNTVVVDGLDQNEGTGYPGSFIETQEYSYQSAFHRIYPQVQHQRGILLYQKDWVVIVDRMLSNFNHSYEQVFHFFPDATLVEDNNLLRAIDIGTDKAVALSQVKSGFSARRFIVGQEDPYMGWCSTEYEVAKPCYYAGFEKKGKNVEFITVIKLGDPNASFSTRLLDDRQESIVVQVNDQNESFTVSITDFLGPAEAVAINRGNPSPAGPVDQNGFEEQDQNDQNNGSPLMDQNRFPPFPIDQNQPSIDSNDSNSMDENAFASTYSTDQKNSVDSLDSDSSKKQKPNKNEKYRKSFEVGSMISALVAVKPKKKKKGG